MDYEAILKDILRNSAAAAWEPIDYDAWPIVHPYVAVYEFDKLFIVTNYTTDWSDMEIVSIHNYRKSEE